MSVVVEDGAEIGLRERKKQQTREALHRAAVRLVAERGLAQSTIEDIAEAADVSPRTFFNYFSTKESAVLGMHSEAAESVARWLHDRPADESPVEAVRASLRRYAETIAADKEMWNLRRAVVHKEPSIFAALAAASTALERRLAAALAERMGVDPEVDFRPTLLVSVTWAAIRVGMSHSREHDISVSEAIDEALEAFDDL